MAVRNLRWQHGKDRAAICPDYIDRPCLTDCFFRLKSAEMVSPRSISWLFRVWNSLHFLKPVRVRSNTIRD